MVCDSSDSETWRASGVKSRISTTTMVVRVWVCSAVVGMLRVVISRTSRDRVGGRGIAENQLLIAENQAILVVQQQRQAHPPGVHEGTVAAAQIHQRVLAAILALDQARAGGRRSGCPASPRSRHRGQSPTTGRRPEGNAGRWIPGARKASTAVGVTDPNVAERPQRFSAMEPEVLNRRVLYWWSA